MDHEAGDQSRSAFRARNFARILRMRWRSIALVTLACVVAVLVLSLLQPRLYSSTATGLVVPVGEDTLSSALAGDTLAQSKAVDYGSLATSRSFAEAVVSELDLEATPEQLLQNIEASVPEETVQIRITAHGQSPQAAADLANAWVNALSNQVEAVETDGGTEAVTAARVTLQPLNSAGLPTAPSSPQVQRNVALSIVAGLFLGLLYAFARHALDRRIWSLDEIEDDHGIPVLGVIPQEKKLAQGGAVADARLSTGRGGHEYLEALRELRTNLRFASDEAPPRIVVVTSPSGGEGKSTLTADLAVAVATTGRKVVVVDGNLRRPGLSDLFGRRPGAGLTEVLTGNVRVDEALQHINEHPGLFLLGAGHEAGNEADSPAELLSSSAMRPMLESLAGVGALVLVDSPPALSSTDASLLTACADGAVVVVSARNTTTDELSSCLDSLRRVRGDVLGVVLNQVPSRGPDAVFYGYHPKTYTASKHRVSRGLRSDAGGSGTPLGAGSSRESPAV